MRDESNNLQDEIMITKFLLLFCLIMYITTLKKRKEEDKVHIIV